MEGSALLRKDGEAPLFDGLGSERTVTNSSQPVQGTVTYDGFGQTVATSGSSTNPYMFAATSGYRNDGDAGLMRVGARYYDAQVGRFITRDTILSQKPYIYCHADPVNRLDPSGHMDWDEVIHNLWNTYWTGIGALIGGIIGGPIGGLVGSIIGVGVGEGYWSGLVKPELKADTAPEPEPPAVEPPSEGTPPQLPPVDNPAGTDVPTELPIDFPEIFIG